jgi:branched-chain amino acid transport system permease protein
MVLCLAPRVILLDEPAAGMTNEETRELSALVRILARYTTVIVVEHDMEFVRTLEGHVTVLHQGEVFAEGDIDTLRANDRVLDIYLGRRAHV